MFATRVRKTAAAAVLVAGVLGAAAPAHAIQITGAWDPPIGGAFPGVTWAGEVTINFPSYTDCTSSSNCNAASYFTDDAIIKLTEGTATEIVAWDREDLGAVTSMNFTGSLLSGLTSYQSEYFRAASGPLVAGGSFFSLSFVGSAAGGGIQARLALASCRSDDDIEHVHIGSTTYNMVEGERCNSPVFNDSTNFPAVVEGEGILTAVPEPKTYVLMLAGMAIVGFVVRRRRRD